MLNPFPELLDFALPAVFLLRFVLGIFFVRFGYLKLSRDKEVKMHFFEQAGLRPAYVFLWGTALLEIVGGLMLVFGVFTQIAALVLSILMLGSVIIKIRNTSALRNDLEFYVLLFIATLSLLFLGPGIFAFDLPL